MIYWDDTFDELRNKTEFGYGFRALSTHSS
jgi:hypothetical protein